MGSVPAVSVLNLRKSFAGEDVLKGVSFTAHDHDVISIIGSSGSGKSTLLRCINFLELPDEGEIRIRDELVEVHQGRYSRRTHPKQIARLRSRLGMVFQNFNLWPHLTALENVIEAPKTVLKMPEKTAIEKAEYLLQKVGLYDKRHAYPATLSGGQKQRVAIARALAMDPHVLLFDEPTSALDPELVNEVLGVIRDLVAEGRTMILVTHEMRFAREVSTEIIFLHQGRIADQGTPQQVLLHPRTAEARKFLGLPSAPPALLPVPAPPLMEAPDYVI
jgi:octopine/nopaline transport system ATP-binding protein